MIVSMQAHGDAYDKPFSQCLSNASLILQVLANKLLLEYSLHLHFQGMHVMNFTRQQAHVWKTITLGPSQLLISRQIDLGNYNLQFFYGGQVLTNSSDIMLAHC